MRWLVVLAIALLAPWARADDGRERVVHLIELSGELGRDFAAAPLEDALLDALESRADAVVLSVDSRTPLGAPLDEEVERYLAERLEQAEAILRVCRDFEAGVFGDRMMCGPAPRLVVWIREAQGVGAAMLWASGQAYFHPDARCGCGSLWAQRARVWNAGAGGPSALPAPAARLAEDAPLFRAMCEPGGGQAARDASGQDADDYLTLTAQTAEQVGASRGAAWRLDQLLALMDAGAGGAGGARWRVERDAPAAILQAWRDSVIEAEETVLLNLRLAAITRDHGSPGPETDETEIFYLDRAYAAVNEYAGALDHRRLGAWPDEIHDVIAHRIGALMGRSGKPSVRRSPDELLAARDDGVDGPVVYAADLDGVLGTTLTTSLLSACLERAAGAGAQAVVLRLDCAVARSSEEWSRVEWELVDALRAMGDRIDRFERGEWPARTGQRRRVVLWLTRAEGVAGLLPLVVRDTVFASGATLGGLGFLENCARETEIRSRQMCTYGNSAESIRRRLERASARFGHPPQLARALLRPEWSLITNALGAPEFVERTATPMGDRSESELAPLAPDRFVSLDAHSAKALGLSIGTADTLLGVIGVAGLGADRVRIVREGAVVQAWRAKRAADVREYGRHAREVRRLLALKPPSVEDLEERVERLQAMRVIERACGNELLTVPAIEGVWLPDSLTASLLARDRSELRKVRAMITPRVTPSR